MSTSRPRISVAIPTCRRAHYLERSLASVLAQTRLPDEIVVSEDGADPETSAVIAAISGGDVRIRHYRNTPPLGQTGNRRRAFELTEGDFVAMLDDDDEWLPEFLERASEALLERPDCAFAMADHWLIDENGNVLPRETDLAARRFGRDRLTTGVYRDVLLRHLTSKTMTLVTSLFRRAALEQFGFIPQSAPESNANSADVAPDFALFVELGARGASVHYLAQRLGAYRIHPGQTINGSRVAFGKSVLDTLRRTSDRYELGAEEQVQLGRLFGRTSVELAIAYAHEGRRGTALRTLRSQRELAVGLPSVRRLIVLVALLLGARPSGRRRRRA